MVSGALCELEGHSFHPSCISKGKILSVSAASQGLKFKDIRPAVMNRTCVDANSGDLLTFFFVP